jgi:hypothetical protein
MPTPPVVREQGRYHAQFDANAAARKSQGYTTRPDGCWNCQHLTYDIRQVSNGVRDRYTTHPENFNPHCGLGGFAVILRATCASCLPKAVPTPGAISANDIP